MLSFNVLTCRFAGDGSPCFGTLHKCGVLARFTYPITDSYGEFGGVDVEWKTKVPCRINGVDYAAGDSIWWYK